MISVIGSGPAGNYFAYLAAKKGYEVNVYEEHSQIGDPIQCSGVVTPEIKKYITLPKKIIVNRIKKVCFYSPDGNSFETKIPEDYVFNRKLLDQHIASLANKAGANFYFKKRFIDYSRISKDVLRLKFKDSSNDTNILVGADGPYSSVAKSANLFDNRKFIMGTQARANADIRNKNTVEIFLGYGEFGWLIPENEEVARIGVVSEGNNLLDFNSLMKKCNASRICFQSGMIPLYNPYIKTSSDGVYLIGDAATMVKAATHGSILYSMIAGKCLLKSINENLDYDSLWRKKLGFDLWLNLKIRNTLAKFSDNDFNDLVKYFSNEKMKNILASNVRDFPSRFILKLLASEPRLAKFIFKLL